MKISNLKAATELFAALEKAKTRLVAILDHKVAALELSNQEDGIPTVTLNRNGATAADGRGFHRFDAGLRDFPLTDKLAKDIHRVLTEAAAADIKRIAGELECLGVDTGHSDMVGDIIRGEPGKPPEAKPVAEEKRPGGSTSGDSMDGVFSRMVNSN
jgi:hypothetical protein